MLGIQRGVKAQESWSPPGAEAGPSLLPSSAGRRGLLAQQLEGESRLVAVETQRVQD